MSHKQIPDFGQSDWQSNLLNKDTTFAPKILMSTTGEFSEKTADQVKEEHWELSREVHSLSEWP
jgi:hypothetical protein